MARPTKYAPAVVKKIVEALLAGNTREIAARYGGVASATFYTWLDQYPEFLENVLDAETRAVCRNVAIISRAAQRDPKWAAWWLERRCPRDWKPRVGIDISEAEVDAQITYLIGQISGGPTAALEGPI